MLSDFFEKTALIKMLDFVMDEWETDFSQAELARETGLNWKTVHELMPKLLEMELVRPNRVISRAKMYKVNPASESFKALKMVDRCISATILHEGINKIGMKVSEGKRTLKSS